MLEALSDTMAALATLAFFAILGTWIGMALTRPKKKGEENANHTTYVSCQDCKHLLDARNAQYVPVYHHRGLSKTGTHKYYCPQHRKPWDWETYTRKFATFKVDAEGTPEGYKPIKK